MDVWVVVERRHLRRESIYWSSELIECLIIFKLAATLPTVSLAVIALERRHAAAVLRIVHCAAVDAGQAGLRAREVVNVLDGQHLELR